MCETRPVVLEQTGEWEEVGQGGDSQHLTNMSDGEMRPRGRHSQSLSCLLSSVTQGPCLLPSPNSLV